MRFFLLLAGILAFTACTELNNVISDVTDKDDSEEQDSMITLPTAVDSYITTNYPNHTIEEAEYDSTCTGSVVIEVELENGNDEIELTFDTEDNFISSSVEIDSATLPTAVSSSISTNFPNYTLDDEAEEITLADGTMQYEVELESAQDELEVLFAADGTVICQEVD